MESKNTIDEELDSLSKEKLIRMIQDLRARNAGFLSKTSNILTLNL
jgi:hypothetical protein